MPSQIPSIKGASSFTAPQVAKLQPHAYLLSHLSPTSASAKPIRPDGRRELQCRSPTIHTGSLTHSNGSSVVRLGRTTVVCGVRAEILSANEGAGWRVKSGGEKKDYENDTEEEDEEEGDEEIASLHLLVPNIELNTGCAPTFIPGGPPSTLAQTLSARLLSLLHTSKLVRSSDLRIYGPKDHSDDLDTEMDTDESIMTAQKTTTATELKAFWTLYIDITVLSHDGALFDAITLATISSLRATLLPAATWDSDTHRVLCDPSFQTARKLGLRGLPIPCTFAVFEESERGRNIEAESSGEGSSWLLADPDAFEEGLCAEGVTVVVDRSDGGEVKIVKIEKSGGGALGIGEMQAAVEVAARRWEEVSNILRGGFR